MKRKALTTSNCKILFIVVSAGIYISPWTFTVFLPSINVENRKGMSKENRLSPSSIYLSQIGQMSSKLHVNSSQNRNLRVNEISRKGIIGNSNITFLDNELFCTMKSVWNLRYFSKTVTSNMSSWTYEEKALCSKFLLSEQILQIEPKLAFSMQCEGSKGKVINKRIQSKKLSNDDIFRVNFGDHCLVTYINSCCKDILPIPNVVHFVRYGKNELTFFEFVSFISVIRFIRPCLILIHGDVLPKGDYWTYILNLSPNMVHVKRDPPDVIFGKKRIHKEHASDIMRIEALILYGGIYLDTDTVVVKSLNPLRKYPCSMSLQSSGYMSSAFIMAEQNATFLQKWLDGYKYEYKVESYVYNAMVYPVSLSRKFKDLIHVEYGRLSRPWKQIGKIIYTTNCNWKGIYGIHLFSRSFGIRASMNEDTVKHFNSTVGSICRHILYGNKELCLT